MAEVKTSYSASDIGWLEGLAAVRRHPAMYVGGKDATGAFRLYREIVDNAVDEHNAGFGNLVQVYYNTKTGYFVVADRGRGVPVDKHERTGESALTVVFTKLHAGGKFTPGVYKNSGGLHGVGASCTNALSDSFEAWSYRSAGPKQAPAWHYQKFSKGTPLTAVIKSDPPKPLCDAKAGTIIRFHPDPEIFGAHVADPERVFSETRDLAMLNSKITIQLAIDDRRWSFNYPDGIVNMALDPAAPPEALMAQPFRMSEAVGESFIDLAMAWYDDDSASLRSFVNSMCTSNGGNHVKGLHAALTKALRDASGTEYEARYWMMGLRVALHWKMTDPAYRSQTKEELSSEVTNEVRDAIQSKLALWFKQQPNMVRKLLDRAEKFRKNEERFRAENKAIKALEIAGKDDQAIDPSKFIQADSWVPAHMRETFLVEGDSAGGTCEKARSPHHEIIKLRGVGVNAQKAESGKTLGNREIKLIIKALGIKPGETDLSKMRTHDITILTDADQDGKHIASLLLAFFKVYYPELVRQGRIRYINGPLYMGQLRDTRKFGDTKEEVLAQFEAKSRNGVRLTRMKGWGEAQPDQLAEIAFNPETRRIVTLTMDVDDEVRIGHIMGKDVEHRKDLLSNGVDDDAEEVA